MLLCKCGGAPQACVYGIAEANDQHFPHECRATLQDCPVCEMRDWEEDCIPCTVVCESKICGTVLVELQCRTEGCDGMICCLVLRSAVSLLGALNMASGNLALLLLDKLVVCCS